MNRLIFLVLFISSTLLANLKTLPQNFYKLDDVDMVKSEFINHFLPIINEENEKILKEREFIESYFDKNFLINFKQRLNRDSLLVLTKIANKYKISKLFNKSEYLRKIDVVPPSLALAQAALESGWGKSRFAKKANNFFGQWNFNGIGLDSLASNSTNQKIKVFESVNDAVSNYMLNLNRHFAYSEFREKRYLSRVIGENFDGIEASKTLINYSELGKKYVSKVQEMINSHDLSLFDKKELQANSYLTAL
ncbi:MAG: glucosaminidase domain-containing protein [Campylobacterales bacterium]|nr:glucosaminidase domain-containing protein [Campylobacterales bacterium]